MLDRFRSEARIGAGLVLLLGCLSGTLAAQAVVRGRAVDTAGTPVEAAIVSIGTGNGRATTDTRGRFILADVPFGTHELVVRAIGYATAHRTVAVTGPVDSLEIVLARQPLALSEVVVTASRSEEALHQVPASVSVVTARDVFERGAVQSGDELAGVPGIFVRKDNEGSFTSVTIRGVRSNHQNENVLAMIDGVPIVTQNEEVDMERLLPLGLIERVEIVKGPSSALYGRGAIAGAINYITRSAVTAPRAEAYLVAGSNGLIQPYFSAAVPLARGSNSLLVSGMLQHKDGWRDRTDRGASNLFLKNDWIVGSRSHLALLFNYNRHTQRLASHVPVTADGEILPLPAGDAANFQIDDAHDRRESWMATGQIRSALSPSLQLEASLHWRGADTYSNVGFNDGFEADPQVFRWNGFAGTARSSTLFFEPQLTWSVRRFRLIVGASAERVAGNSQEHWTGQYGFSPPNDFRFYLQRRSVATGKLLDPATYVTDTLADNEFRAAVLGAYSQLELQIGSRTTVTLGARFDRFDRTVDYAATRSGGELTPGATVADDNQHLSPKVAVAHRWTDDLTTYLSWSQGFSPAFGAIFAFRDRSQALDPEVADNVEVGFKGLLLGGRLSFGAAAYRLTRKDLVLLVSGQGGDLRSVNAGKQRSQGIEVEAKFASHPSGPGFRGHATYTFADVEWLDNRFVAGFPPVSFDYTGLQVHGVPRHLAGFGLGYGTARGSIGFNVQHHGSYFIAASNEGGRHGGHTLVGAYAGYRVRWLGDTDLGLALTNLFDRRYYYVSGLSTIGEAYPGRPREVVATVRRSF